MKEIVSITYVLSRKEANLFSNFLESKKYKIVNSTAGGWLVDYIYSNEQNKKRDGEMVYGSVRSSRQLHIKGKSKLEKDLEEFKKKLMEEK
ncbi:hypothetical protein J4474_04170 [Candidatus Pacearchaeota archaeon]|nr:hypothetical protein [Candidatus Pacearchaeota archaeon]